MTTKSVTISLSPSVVSSPIAKCVQLATQYASKVYMEHDNRKVNAKSIMGMMSLGLKGGDEIQVSADGSDEDKALKSVCGFLEGEN